MDSQADAGPTTPGTPMRVVSVGTRKHTTVYCKDEPGAGGACHEYEVRITEDDSSVGTVSFQNGPVKEEGRNGLHNEDLLAIVVDRLQHFQKGDYSCRENALALTKLEEAMHWLNHRTAARRNRGVEGTHTV